jgi:uncharacterized membrane protein
LRTKIGNDLILLNLLTLALIAGIIFFPTNVLRVILGFPFVLFFPGYALVAALFPRKERMGGIERLALSFGLSIAVTALVLLILNYTLWGVRQESIIYSLASFIFIISVVAWFRRKRLPQQERFTTGFLLRIPSLGTGVWDKTLSIILVLAVLGALVAVGYVNAKPKVGEKFTEFYILASSDKATDYPRELKVREEGKVIIGITNNEGKVVTYQVEVRIAGAKNNETGPITLKPGEKWEGSVSFVPQTVGRQQEVEFLLYKDGKLDPNLKPLHLWVDVTE